MEKMEAVLERMRQVSGADNVIISDCNGVELCTSGKSIEHLELFSAVFQNVRDQMQRLNKVDKIVTEYNEFYLIQQGLGDIHVSVQVNKTSNLQKALDMMERLDIGQLVTAFSEFSS